MVDKLKDISEQLRDGRPVAPVTVRTFLSWFGAQRRGYWIVEFIKKELEKADLVTFPDFESAWLDVPISFIRPDRKDKKEESIKSEQDDPQINEPIAVNAAGSLSWTNKEATFHVSRLQAANQKVVSASPDSSLAEVITLLMASGFSQMPIISGGQTIKGIVSWQSIGTNLALGLNGQFARDFTTKHHEVRWDTPMFDIIPIISAYDCVIVRGQDNKISGIITSADLNSQFRQLSEPFLLLSEIENLTRNMIGEKFSKEELKAACDTSTSGRDIENISDLTFGEYIRLLQHPDRWDKLCMRIDCKVFCGKLDRVRIIRNDVMHFDPDGITGDDLDELRDFAAFLKRLERFQTATSS